MFVSKEQPHSMTNSTENKILYRIRGMGRGSIFYPSRFYDIGSRNAVASALKRLKQNGVIRHLCRGLYDYPKQDSILGALNPELHTFIKALENRENMPIYPSEAYAAYSLGLTEQIPMNPVFIALRPMNVQWGTHTIRINKASAKTLLIKTPQHIILSQALKWIGPQNISLQQIEHLQGLFSPEQKKRLLKDICYMPLNQHPIIHAIVKPNNTLA